MKRETKKIKDFEAIRKKFSGLIRAYTLKFDLQRYGIEIDDIVQEVEIKIWKVFENEKNIENSTSYIKKIISSTVIDHLRKLKREKGIIALEKQKVISEQSLHYEKEGIDEREAKEIIGKAVDALIDSRRCVVKLFLLGMTIDEISSYFDWTRDKTRNLVYRGLADLKEILKKKGITYENK